MDFYKPASSAPLVELIPPTDETDVASDIPVIDLTNDVPDLIDLTNADPELIKMEPLVIDLTKDGTDEAGTGIKLTDADKDPLQMLIDNFSLQRDELKSQNQWYNLPNAMQTEMLLDSFASRDPMNAGVPELCDMTEVDNKQRVGEQVEVKQEPQQPTILPEDAKQYNAAWRRWSEISDKGMSNIDENGTITSEIAAESVGDFVNALSTMGTLKCKGNRAPKKLHPRPCDRFLPEKLYLFIFFFIFFFALIMVPSIT